MKTKIYKRLLIGISFIICHLSFSVALSSCSPDEFEGANASGLPTMEGLDFQINVDQETNQMVANCTPPAGTYPIWILDGTSYSTLSEVGYKNDEAGSHTIELKLGNRNGISQAGVKKQYTFNETKIDYSADFRRITGKEWRIDNKEPGHMGCGEAGTDGSGWWSAAADDKKAFGVYDDRLTFTADTRKGGSYTYYAGEDGLTYVNKETTWANGAAEDVDVALGNQTASWNFEELDWTDKEGNVSKQRYIRLSANTLFPYLSSNAQYEEPLFRVEQLTANKMVLVYDKPDRSIAWRFIFTSKEGEKEWEGFDANSDFNMWKGITPTATFHFQPGWGEVRTDEMAATYSDGGNDYTVTVPDACADRWQAQMHLHTDLSISAANHYDFSCIFVADADIDGVTVKLTNETDADAIIDVDNVSLKAGQEYIFWKSDIEGKDLSPVKLVFDFGRSTGKTTINVSNIVLKNHADNDGTVPPTDNPDTPDNPVGPTMDWDVNSPANLWAPVESGDAFIGVTPWFADDGWSQIGDPKWKHENGSWTLTIPEGMGGSQWQGQFPINTSLTASLSKKYNFYVVLEADQDCNGVTIKLTETDDADGTKHDGNFFFADRHDVKADVPFIYKAEGVSLIQNDAHALSLVFDFGGSPIGTNIKISNIFFEENVSMSYDDANNLWRSVDEGTDFISVTPWFANDGWSQIGDPVWKHEGNKWSLTIPEGMGGSQWQGQFPINTKLATAQNDAYNFQCTILADNDCSGVTIKLTETDDADGTKHDGNFYFADRHDVKADEPFVYKMTGVTLSQNDAHALSLFFDFGGTPIGTNIVISNIIFEKAQ
ncbi:MAG: hypothetical protein J6W19_12870 [Prevotella sp.]|nr:hypothetical protein [Prevotella sp.]